MIELFCFVFRCIASIGIYDNFWNVNYIYLIIDEI